jgi:hypothetical protein
MLPEDVRELVLRREWHNPSALKSRLLGEKAFPLSIGLKPPAGKAALHDLGHFQAFIKAWRDFPQQPLVEWTTRNYQALSSQAVPAKFVIGDFQQLLEYIGEEALVRKQCWDRNMAPLLALCPAMLPVLVRHLQAIEQLSETTIASLAGLLPQLKPGLGAGVYLRALPVAGVDTKFLEEHATLVSDMLDCIHDGQVSARGGLHLWLDCLDVPAGWLMICPLCPEVRARMGDFAILQLPADMLRCQPLPAPNILVIENRQSGLSLPSLPNTVAVFGGGKNVSWMDAEWLKDKQVAYWGDIDSWGFGILSDVRSRLPSVVALMMDRDTLKHHEQNMVEEPESLNAMPGNLTALEAALFSELGARRFQGTRLEQERLETAYIEDTLRTWVTGWDPKMPCSN